MKAIELRNILLDSPAIRTCDNPEETVMILSLFYLTAEARPSPNTPLMDTRNRGN